ncbi:MAG: sigma-70 family RNA polymerase sigma factor [Candidatus Acidiferrum sp.]
MSSVGRPNEAVAAMSASETAFDIEAVFRAHYGRVARISGRVVRDPARAEEIAVEVFLKLWRRQSAQGEHLEAWPYRVAVRSGLDELRRQTRRARYEALVGWALARTKPATPDEVHCANVEQDQVRRVLSVLSPRQAEFLLLRSHGFSYVEVATALKVRPRSIGTLLSRAQQAFRKEYIKRYGQE